MKIKIFSILIILFFSFVNIIPIVNADNFISFNTTSIFDSGLKNGTATSTDNNPCLSYSINSISLNETGYGNYQGIGLTTNSTSCIYGAFNISSIDLVASYDMEHIRLGKLKDFSSSASDGTFTFTNSTVGIFGSARNFSGTSDFISTSSSIPISSNGTILIKIKPISYGNFPQIFGYSSDPAIYSQSTLGKLYLQMLSSSCVSSTAMPLNTWSSWSFSWFWNGLVTILTGWNGNINKCVVSTSNHVTPSSNLFARFNKNRPASFPGYIDEALIFTRNFTNSERLAFSLDGRNKYLNSGTWISQLQTTNNIYPSNIFVSGINWTSTDYPSKISVFSTNNSVLYSTNILYSCSSTCLIPLNLSSIPNSWKVEVMLASNGISTAQIVSIVVQLTIITPTLDTATISIILLIFSLIFLFIIGFIERFAMVGAALVSFIIGILSWTWTGEPYVPAIFTFLGAVCIGLAITQKK